MTIKKRVWRSGALNELTPREKEVLGWLVEGKRDGEIAVILGISPRTVHSHVSHILSKLGVETRTAAARAASREQRPADKDHE